MKPPRGRDALLLYLDFDGVLHHENVLWHSAKGAYLSAPPAHVLFQHAALLQSLLEPLPQVRIVLSTSWVRVFSCKGAADRLPPALRSRVIGATFHSQMDRGRFQAMPRGLQVWRDVQRRQPRDWLALDDDHLDWPSECLDQFIRTDEVLGISAPAVLQKLKDRLLLWTER